MRGRGIDFKQKFNTNRWAEDLLIRSLDDAFGVKTVRYGISTFVPEGEELVYRDSKYKEPDLLVFKTDALSVKEKHLLGDGSLDWKERSALGKAGLDGLLKRAFVGFIRKVPVWIGGLVADLGHESELGLPCVWRS